MSHKEMLAVVDVGSSQIKTLIAEVEKIDSHHPAKINIIGVGMSISAGIRKGTILDMEEFKRNVDSAFEEAEKMAGQEISYPIFLSFSSVHLRVDQNQGIISVPGTEITHEDVSRVLQMAQNGVPLENRSIMKIYPHSFSVDLENLIRSPIGMSGKKLEVHAHIFSVPSLIPGNIKKALNDIGIDIENTYPGILTSSEAVLSRRQRELGVVCIDIGASSTTMSVYEEGSLLYISTIPIGGEHITSDIALGLRVSIDVAEKIKLEYGNTIFNDKKDIEISLSKYDKNETQKISKRFVTEIVRARYQELLFHVNQELKKIQRDGMLPEGIVLTGGGAKIPNLTELSREELRLPASIGLPEETDYISGTSVADPVFSSAFGALILASQYEGRGSGITFHFSLKDFFSSLKKIWKSLLP